MRTGLILFGLAMLSNLIFAWFNNRNNCVERFIRIALGKPADFWAWKRGEEATTTPPAGDKVEIKFTPEQQKALDHIVESRLARERASKADYEDLRKFKEESLRQQDAKTQKELEEQKKYDEAKKGYETQVNQHKEIISKKDQEIIDLKISHALTGEVSNQNGYIEETLALLRSSAVLVDGKTYIKTKDANGIDVQLPVGEGVKRFLEARPHLVKSNFKSGGGAGGGSVPNTNPLAEDLNTLNAQLSEAMTRGDQKTMNELNKKIRGQLQTKRVSI